MPFVSKLCFWHASRSVEAWLFSCIYLCALLLSHLCLQCFLRGVHFFTCCCHSFNAASFHVSFLYDLWCLITSFAQSFVLLDCSCCVTLAFLAFASLNVYHASVFGACTGAAVSPKSTRKAEVPPAGFDVVEKPQKSTRDAVSGKTKSDFTGCSQMPAAAVYPLFSLFVHFLLQSGYVSFAFLFYRIPSFACRHEFVFVLAGLSIRWCL